MTKVLQLATLIGCLFVAARSQRPLNTTTNSTAILTEPFFVKPTSIIAARPHPEQRGVGGGSLFYGNHETTGINRNRERFPAPPHHNLDGTSHLDIFVPPLNGVGGLAMLPAAAPNQTPAANRLHKPNKSRANKFNQLRELSKNGNYSKNGGSGYSLGHGYITHGKIESKPQPFQDPDPNENPADKEISRPSSNGESLKAIRDMQQRYNNQHTPSPPAYNPDEIDFDEKLGVKCTFEKPCAWTWETINVTGSNFEVTTGNNLTMANITGKSRLDSRFD